MLEQKFSNNFARFGFWLFAQRKKSRWNRADERNKLKPNTLLIVNSRLNIYSSRVFIFLIKKNPRSFAICPQVLTAGSSMRHPMCNGMCLHIKLKSNVCGRTCNRKKNFVRLKFICEKSSHIKWKPMRNPFASLKRSNGMHRTLGKMGNDSVE